MSFERYSNIYQSFIQLNSKFWSNFNINNTEKNKGLLLVEPDIGITNMHINGIVGNALKYAKGYKIAWLNIDDDSLWQCIKSYNKDSINIKLSQLNFTEQLFCRLLCKWYRFKMKSPDDILKVKIDGVNIGDIIYDTYLHRKKFATINKIDTDLIRFMTICITNYYTFKKTLLNNKVQAVIINHFVGIASGIFRRVALKLKLNTYMVNDGCILLKKSLKETKDWECTLDESVYNYFKKNKMKFINREFENYMLERKNAKTDADAVFAYQKEKKIYSTKTDFAKHYGLDDKKKNVFVMLHSFNDHPLASTKSIIFRDYFDWFYQTLTYSKKRNDVNWIFKEHPTSIYYPTLDIELKSFFNEKEEFIKFLDRDESFNTSSLFHIADFVITCVGTAGVEMATCGIPTIVAGQHHFTGFGFTHEPKNKSEYFKLLDNIDNLGKLNEEQQFNAKVVFLYAQKYFKYTYFDIPELTYEDARDEHYILDNYLSLILKIYTNDSEKLQYQFNELINGLKNDKFKRTIGFPDIDNFNFFANCN